MLGEPGVVRLVLEGSVDGPPSRRNLRLPELDFTLAPGEEAKALGKRMWQVAFPYQHFSVLVVEDESGLAVDVVRLPPPKRQPNETPLYTYQLQDGKQPAVLTDCVRLRTGGRVMMVCGEVRGEFVVRFEDRRGVGMENMEPSPKRGRSDAQDEPLGNRKNEPCPTQCGGVLVLRCAPSRGHHLLWGCSKFDCSRPSQSCSFVDNTVAASVKQVYWRAHHK
jgi:hypothetical protein